ncbi:MAG: helix-turn-helix domain-containing protein [Syntrophobacteraceae bacterium]
MSLKEIARKVGLSWQACLKWRKRFLTKSIEGLRDMPRSGKPPVITQQSAAFLPSFFDEVALPPG